MTFYDPLKPVVTSCATSFNKSTLRTRTVFMYMYMDVRKSSNYFPRQHLLTGFKKRDGECCLWRYAVGWKVVVSIPDGVIKIFYLYNSFSHTIALGSTNTNE